MPQLANLIHREIAERGPIPFARFMELALYCPELGFYEKEGDNVGRGGDFYTSVSIGPLFGELLAFKFVKWLEERAAQNAERGAERLRIVEAGAHDAKLAADILSWLQRQRPEVLAETEYCILEPSARRREWQRARLEKFEAKVRWLDHLANHQSPTDHRQFTVAFSNELLDAMPVRRFGWDASRRQWFEWGVGSDGESLIWMRLAKPLHGEKEGLPSNDELLAVLPDGYIVEISSLAEQWWADAARGLQQGKLVAFDYGFAAGGQLQPERRTGTLRAYHQHKVSGDVLDQPGEQDITAHVNFPRIEQVGLAAGLVTESFASQAQFLTGVAAEAWKTDSGFGDWDQKRTRQFQTLTHPEHLGSRFRVLVQSRG
jgi:SAM-dependent MidA family methyltransferase